MNVAEAVWRSLNNQMTIFVYFLTRHHPATCTSFNAFHKLFVPLTAVTNDLLMSIASCSNENLLGLKPSAQLYGHHSGNEANNLDESHSVLQHQYLH